jgi:hypothetical protein
MPANTDNEILGAVKFILSRNKSPVALISMSESDVTKPPLSTKLPEHANDAPFNKDEASSLEQVAVVILEVEVAFAKIGSGANTNKAHIRRNIELSS